MIDKFSINVLKQVIVVTSLQMINQVQEMPQLLYFICVIYISLRSVWLDNWSYGT